MSNDLFSEDALRTLAAATGKALQASGHMLVTAESCTGGGIMKMMTDIAGSSDWCEGGFIVYTNRAKQHLGVSAQILAEHGAVSQACVEALAQAALANSEATVSVAVSGIAGPSGGSPDKPVGTVWIAWATRDGLLESQHYLFAGDRDAVRRQTIGHALAEVKRFC